jgi:hypothetical protein
VTTDGENGISSELLGRLEAAAAGASDDHAIAEGLKVTDEERRSAPGHLQAAFEYAEAPPRPEPVGVGSFFGPMMEFGDQRYPPAATPKNTEPPGSSSATPPLRNTPSNRRPRLSPAPWQASEVSGGVARGTTVKVARRTRFKTPAADGRLAATVGVGDMRS